jgi:hypothetical protein
LDGVVDDEVDDNFICDKFEVDGNVDSDEHRWMGVKTRIESFDVDVELVTIDFGVDIVVEVGEIGDENLCDANFEVVIGDKIRMVCFFDVEFELATADGERICELEMEGFDGNGISNCICNFLLLLDDVSKMI